MSMLEFEAYHPVVEVLVSRFEVDADGLENLTGLGRILRFRVPGKH